MNKCHKYSTSDTKKLQLQGLPIEETDKISTGKIKKMRVLLKMCELRWCVGVQHRVTSRRPVLHGMVPLLSLTAADHTIKTFVPRPVSTLAGTRFVPYFRDSKYFA